MVAHPLHGGLHGYLGVLSLGCKLVMVPSGVSRLETMLRSIINLVPLRFCARDNGTEHTKLPCWSRCEWGMYMFQDSWSN
jgi:hypothetical protein